MERTLILVKPDAFERNLTGEIIARFERKGLRLAALKLMTMNRELAQQHYAEHEGKPFFEELVSFITSGPLVAMVLEGESVVKAARQVIGATNPLEASPGSIRGESGHLGRAEHGPRLGLTRVRPAGSRAVLPRALILASGSPQRRAILEQLGVAFSVVVPGVEELEAGPPNEVAVENAYRKAAAVAGDVVLGVDTVVSVGARIYGKPAGAEAARATLSALSGRRHVVTSGVCVIEGGRARTAAATTMVSFRSLSAELIDWYAAGEEWRGRAGGYAIQGRGAALVAGIEGDYWNVVGLPVGTLLELLPDLLPGG